MKQYFFELADYAVSLAGGREVLLLNCSAEESDFVRFNHGLVRQPGSVTQRYLTLDLISGQRRTAATLSLIGQADADRDAVRAELDALRRQLPHVPEDPYLLYATEVRNTEQVRPGQLAPREEVIDAVARAGKGKDLVGIYAAGDIHAGFANSLGQRNWFAAKSFHLDWSLYHSADKAVKTSYADTEWDSARFACLAEEAAAQLPILARPPRTVPPGRYRVFLAPAALNEFVGMLSWGGFGLKAHRTRFTPLLRMVEQGAALAGCVTLRENTAEGLAPNFQSSGFVKPPAVTMIEGGRYRDCLVSPRSAKEYGAATNGAEDGEAPQSLDLAAGTLDDRKLAEAIGTGAIVNRLWYLNFSDRPAGRITGMTRFGTYWVENGEIVAPLNVMRFDETVYRVLGENLEGLTEWREFIPSSSTYGERSTSSARLPGALVKDFTFTL